MLWRAPTIRRDPSLAIPRRVPWRRARRRGARAPSPAQAAAGTRAAARPRSRGSARPRAARSASSACLASRSHLAAVPAVRSPSGSSSPRASPNSSSSAASMRAASSRISARDLLVVARRRDASRWRAIFVPSTATTPTLTSPAARAQRQHLAEQLGDRRLVTHAEARDRRVIGRLVGGDHAERDVLATAPLDRPRRPLPDRVGVDATTRPSSPDHAPRDHARRRDRPHRTPPDRSRRRHRARTTRGDPPAATRAGSAATTAPAHDHTR